MAVEVIEITFGNRNFMEITRQLIEESDREKYKSFAEYKPYRTSVSTADKNSLVYH